MNHLSPPDERLTRPEARTQISTSKPSLDRSPHPYQRRSATLTQSSNYGLSPPSSQPTSRSESTESGTEADDEKGIILRGLPAPPVRSHKGLRGSTPLGLSPAVTPLPTPPATRQIFFFDSVGDQHVTDQSEEQRRQNAYRQRKKAEIVRRVTETILLASIVAIIGRSVRGQEQLQDYTPSIVVFLLVTLLVYGLYPVRKSLVEFSAGKSLTVAIRSGFHLPSRFDPGPLLYPVVLPFVIALSLGKASPRCIPISIVCGLASMPERVFNVASHDLARSFLRWGLSMAPLSESIIKLVPSGMSSTGLATVGLNREVNILLYPLHQAVRRVLNYLTTTSLDPVELELLSTGLIHLFMFAQSPQAKILKAVLWIGGLSIFASCRYLMVWEVELARIPRWKFSKVPHKSAISHRLTRAFSAFMSDPIPTSESSDDEVDQRAKPQPKSLQRVKTLANPPLRKLSINGRLSKQRRATISDLDPVTTKLERRLQRNRNVQASPFLALTVQQAKIRKYFYAAIVYGFVFVTILLPVRYYVGVAALAGNEPFGWAGGYLFGNIPRYRELVYQLRLTSWVPLPDRLTTDDGSFSSLSETYLLVSQPANLRLALGAYCVSIVGLGIIVVLQLTAYVEVDTRRKVFHGVMVFMLLPTIFIDPCFFALALSLILAVFLLLDLFRASQLPPVSRPLTAFLAPYVDGRDHRGPVIVSHIFLLIGCAIPLWLSLAGVDRKGQEPWQGWEVEHRDLSMIAGVVCVGMGDAAASLVGRRYGRTKWYWGGGKSLEGSLAFAVAVTIGLSLAWLWLRVGGWVEWTESTQETAVVVLKCATAASGASLLESVLTAANDNVVVPIGLWLLVRGLQI